MKFNVDAVSHTNCTGNYSRLTVYFRFERQIGHHLIQTFAPSTLVVMLSWFSFWLGLDAIPGRVTLLVTCMLTLVTMFTGLRADIPPVAYVKVLVVCVAFARFTVVDRTRWFFYNYLSLAGIGSMDGRLHGVCVCRPWGIRGSKSARRSISISNQPFTKSTADGECKHKHIFILYFSFMFLCSSHCQCTMDTHSGVDMRCFAPISGFCSTHFRYTFACHLKSIKMYGIRMVGNMENDK